MNNFDDCVKALNNKLKSYDENFEVQKVDYPVANRDYVIKYKLIIGGEHLYNDMIVEFSKDKPENAHMYINERYRDEGRIDYSLVEELYQEFLEELKG